MRTLAVTLGLSLLVSTAPAAQTSTSQWTLLPANTPRVRADFGLTQARKNLPEVLVVRPAPPAPRHELPFSQWRQVLQPASPAPAIDCEMVKTHRHDVLSVAMPTIKPPSDARHHLKVVTVAPCPVR